MAILTIPNPPLRKPVSIDNWIFTIFTHPHKKLHLNLFITVDRDILFWNIE